MFSTDAHGEITMDISENPIIEQMVFFISNLMLLVDPELEDLNENGREEFIFLFFQNAGLIEVDKV
jgi:hypothetical protein